MTGRRERSVFGRVALGLFIVFNLVCLWLVSETLHLASDPAITSDDNLYQNMGFFLGAGAAYIEVIIWFFGAVVLGILTLLTRGKVQDQR